MKLPLYQYSKELKCWIWVSSLQVTGFFEQYCFPKGSFGFVLWSLKSTEKLCIDFMNNVKTIQIPLS